MHWREISIHACNCTESLGESILPELLPNWSSMHRLTTIQTLNSHKAWSYPLLILNKKRKNQLLPQHQHQPQELIIRCPNSNIPLQAGHLTFIGRGNNNLLFPWPAAPTLLPSYTTAQVQLYHIHQLTCLKKASTSGWAQAQLHEGWENMNGSEKQGHERESVGVSEKQWYAREELTDSWAAHSRKAVNPELLIDDLTSVLD